MKYSQDLKPYHCSKCDKWHLSPKKNMTPSKTCLYCTDGNGKNKESYLTKQDAERRAEIIFNTKHIRLSVYECEHSTGWHLTKG